MNFVVKLSKLGNLATKEVFDSIIVIINKLLKYAIIVPFKEIYKAD